MPAESLVLTLSNQAAPRRLPRMATLELSLFLFAYLVHLGVTQLLRGEHGSGLEWAVVAQNVLAGRGFVFNFYGTEIPRHAFFPPFYSYFLVFSKTVLPAHWIGLVQSVQGVFFALCAVWTRRLAARFIRGDLAWFSGYAVALWPPLMIYSIRLTPACFHAAVIPGLLLLLDGVARRPGFWRAARAGAVYGLLGYSLPYFLGSIVLLPFGLRRARISWARAFSITGQILLVAALVLSPWTIRNALVLRGLVPVATNLGFNLAGSHNAYANSSYNVLCVDAAVQAHLIDRGELATMNEASFDRKLLRQGLAYMLRNPVETVQRSLTRILFLWWTSPNIMSYNFREGLAIILLMSFLLPLFLLGLAVSLRLPRDSARLLICCVFIWQTLFYMNFAVRGRYSLELYPLMIIFATLGVGAAAEWFGRRRRNSERSRRPIPAAL
ncbi:MAG: hypothetical protein NTX17_09150 [Candidatus Eisenbacteria bacterium]|nr:hypothetical protein [Candidatus Eisenbacteria bacterium]